MYWFHLFTILGLTRISISTCFNFAEFYFSIGTCLFSYKLKYKYIKLIHSLYIKCKVGIRLFITFPYFYFLPGIVLSSAFLLLVFAFFKKNYSEFLLLGLSFLLVSSKNQRILFSFFHYVFYFTNFCSILFYSSYFY